MQTLFFLIMDIVSSLSKMKTKLPFRRKLVTFIKMCTKTRNNRKKRSKWTNTTKSPEISEATETKLQINVTLQALFYSRFVLIWFFHSFLHFCFGCLGGVAFIETRFCFATSSFCKEYIYIYISFIITLKLGSSRLNRYLFLSLLPS